MVSNIILYYIMYFYYAANKLSIMKFIILT